MTVLCGKYRVASLLAEGHVQIVVHPVIGLQEMCTVLH